MKKIYVVLSLVVLFVISNSMSRAQITLYGYSCFGGPNNGAGTIFTVDAAGTVTDVYNFGSIPNDGYSLQGCSPMEAKNGLLYGMTELGGLHEYCGTLFSYNVTSGVETILKNFVGKTGNDPYGSLVQASNGLLYGMTLEGSDTAGDVFNDSGTIFSYNTSNGAFNVVHTFDDSIQDGNSPHGSLIQASNSGLLYGLLEYGGVDSVGVLFSYNITNGDYTIVHTFARKNDGYYPFGNLLQVGDLLYGTTQNGGTNDDGTIFSYNISNGNYAVLYSFNGPPADGATPTGTLIEATNDLLYGLCYNGGADSAGTIFSYNTVSGVETSLHNFKMYTSADGALPTSSIMQASNGLLYGVTFYGGTTSLNLNTSDGAIFSYDINTATETDLYDCPSGTIVNHPGCKLLEYAVPTGVQELGVNSDLLSVYPNPTTGIISIKINSSAIEVNDWNLRITDVLGRTVYTMPSLNYNNTIDLSRLTNGIYFITVITKTGNSVFSFIKQN